MVKDLDDHSTAVGLCNRGQTAQTITARWSDVGVEGKQLVRDPWRRRDLGVFEDGFSAAVDRRGVVLVRIRPQK
jgi:alpha-galactosidase